MIIDFMENKKFIDNVFDVVTFVKFFNEFQNLKKNYFESSSKFGSEAN